MLVYGDRERHRKCRRKVPRSARPDQAHRRPAAGLDRHGEPFRSSSPRRNSSRASPTRISRTAATTRLAGARGGAAGPRRAGAGDRPSWSGGFAAEGALPGGFATFLAAASAPSRSAPGGRRASPSTPSIRKLSRRRAAIGPGARRGDRPAQHRHRPCGLVAAALGAPHPGPCVRSATRSAAKPVDGSRPFCRDPAPTGEASTRSSTRVRASRAARSARYWTGSRRGSRARADPRFSRARRRSRQQASVAHRARWHQVRRHVVGFDELVVAAPRPAHRLATWLADTDRDRCRARSATFPAAPGAVCARDRPGPRPTSSRSGASSWPRRATQPSSPASPASTATPGAGQTSPDSSARPASRRLSRDVPWLPPGTVARRCATAGRNDRSPATAW